MALSKEQWVALEIVKRLQDVRDNIKGWITQTSIGSFVGKDSQRITFKLRDETKIKITIEKEE